MDSTMIIQKNLHQVVIIFVLIASITTGCRSTDEYKKFANAGSQYTNAVDKLLDTASNIRIDTTSEQLLRNDRILNQTIEDYQKLAQVDEERLEVLGKLVQNTVDILTTIKNVTGLVARILVIL
ncbi:hypothetical protein [Nostoc sp. 'Peltigera membranacea cyanobiont' 213]|uniref:hypothetical protein n=1 Tax=Nostoc sp. 'Peltigera membranacea cyanobiont' 213 TaxID=2014530 RepID=UPI001CB89122|nr:hypothetical protein [Nostoc sp. 'Peltigera membranacea cyanobiont' 213]